MEENSVGQNILDQVEISSINSNTGFAGEIFLDAPNSIEITDSQLLANGNFGVIFIGDLITPSQVTISGQRTTNTDNSSGFNYTTNLTTTNLDLDNGLAGAIEIYARDEINISGSRLDSTTDIANLDSNESVANNNLSTINLTASQGSIFLADSEISATNNNDRGNAVAFL